MEHNGEEGAEQKTEDPIPVKKRSERVNHFK